MEFNSHSSPSFSWRPPFLSYPHRPLRPSQLPTSPTQPQPTSFTSTPAIDHLTTLSHLTTLYDLTTLYHLTTLSHLTTLPPPHHSI